MRQFHCNLKVAPTSVQELLLSENGELSETGERLPGGYVPSSHKLLINKNQKDKHELRYEQAGAERRIQNKEVDHMQSCPKITESGALLELHKDRNKRLSDINNQHAKISE